MTATDSESLLKIARPHRGRHHARAIPARGGRVCKGAVDDLADILAAGTPFNSGGQPRRGDNVHIGQGLDNERPHNLLCGGDSAADTDGDVYGPNTFRHESCHRVLDHHGNTHHKETANYEGHLEAHHPHHDDADEAHHQHVDNDIADSIADAHRVDSGVGVGVAVIVIVINGVGRGADVVGERPLRGRDDEGGRVG